MDQDYVCKVFADSVAETAPHEPALPLVHTTSAYRFDLIAEKGLLKATKCNVYHGESLLYLFYGRPAFRPPDGDKIVKLEQLAPVCLVLRTDVAAAPKRVMPFDSGAYASGLLNDHHDSHMQKEEFELPSDVTSAQKIVAAFFGASNENYYNERLTAPAGDHDGNWHVETYISLVTKRTNNTTDSRASAVEIQLDHHVTLAGNVLAVVMPAPTWQRPQVQSLLKRWGAAPLVYRLPATFRRNELCRAIEDQVLGFLRDNGYL